MTDVLGLVVGIGMLIFGVIGAMLFWSMPFNLAAIKRNSDESVTSLKLLIQEQQKTNKYLAALAGVPGAKPPPVTTGKGKNWMAGIGESG